VADRPPSIDRPTVVPFGDAAFLVTAGFAVDPVLAAWARSLASRVDSGGVAGVGRAVPAHASVLVPFEPLTVDGETVRGLVDWGLSGVPPVDPRDEASAAAPVEIPVRYGGDDGPDLEAVAELHGIRAADVVELHAGSTYRVLFLGFAPGFAYLGGLPEALATPRRSSPRERVPAGSVGISGSQTGVYPLAMPGGWNLIGRTDTVLFDPDKPDPARLDPGATVRFVPVRNR
jgi:inhibitor of KinA